MAGEVTTEAYADIPAIVRDRILDIGYDSSRKGFDGSRAGSASRSGPSRPTSRRASIPPTSPGSRAPRTRSRAGRRRPGPDVRLRVRRHARADAGADLAGAPAGGAAHRGAQERRSCPTCGPTARPRSRSSTSTDKPVRLDTVVISSQHAEDIDLDTLLKPDIEEHVVMPVLDGLAINTAGYRLLVNPTGRFVTGGPDGRRRADRSQDHRRYLRRLRPPRRRGVLRQGPVQGRPVGVLRDAVGGQERRRGPARHQGRGAGRVRDRQGRAGRACSSRRSAPRRWIPTGSPRPSAETFDLRPAAIIRDLDLLRPIYAQTAAYGHFGRELPDFTWERTDRAEQLAKLANG